MPTRFDDYEVHGVREYDEHGRTYCEQVPDNDAQFWSLFGHIPGQGVDCIGDFKTREHAEEVYARITRTPLRSPSSINRQAGKESAMSFVSTMRKALAGEITVKTWWGCNGLTGEAFHQWFRQRLNARINREDRRQWRRLSDDYQASLMRDAIRVREITHQRIIHRQFETDIVNARLGHLLTRRED